MIPDRPSDRCIDFIKSFEKFSARAYKAVPTERYYTIGYGHYDKSVKPTDVVTMEEALGLLGEDIAVATRGLREICDTDHISLSQCQYDALVSFCFNCGTGNFAKSTMRRKLAAGDYAGAADEFPKWCRSGGRVLAGLVRRRAEERRMFLGPA